MATESKITKVEEGVVPKIWKLGFAKVIVLTQHSILHMEKLRQGKGQYHV